MGLLTITCVLEAHGSGGETGEDEQSFELTGSAGYAEVRLDVVNGFNEQANLNFVLTRHLFNSYPSGASATLSETFTIPVKLDQFISIGTVNQSSVVAAVGETASAAALANVSFTLAPMPFIWTGAQGSAYNHGPNWEGGIVPNSSSSVQLANTTSTLLLDTARTQTGLTMPGGGDHLFVLNGHTFGVGAEGVTLAGGRLTISNGTLDAAGQNTRVGSTEAIPSMLVVSQGGTGTTFKTGNLLVGHTGDGEVQIGNGGVDVGTVLTLGATPGAKGTIRMDRGGLDVKGGAAIGIPPGSGSRIIAQNESVIFWNDAATATFDHESHLEARGEGTFSFNGKFAFRGGSRLLVENSAVFQTFSGADALILDGSTAEFNTSGKGELGNVHLKNDATMFLATDSVVTAKNLIVAEEGEAMVAVFDSSLTVSGDSVSLASETPNSEALLSVADGRIELDVDFVFAGMDKGKAEIFLSKGGNVVFPRDTLIQMGSATGQCKYTVVNGGKSQGGNFVFVEKSRLRVEGAGSTFEADDIFLGAGEPRFYDFVSADFRDGSASHFGKALLGICDIRISEGAAVAADALKLDGASVLLQGNGSILEAAAAATVDAPSMFILLGENTTFRGGTLVMGDQASILGKGTLAFTTVTNNGGLISPGFSPGILTVNGSLNQTAGRIVLEIGGTEPGISHDQLIITGDFNFTGGVIELVFTDGFAPQAGQTFELLDIAGQAIGTPAVNVRGLEPGWDFAMVRDPETGVLKVNSLSNGVALPPVRVTSLTVSAATGGGPGKQVTASVTGPPAAEVVLEASNDLRRWFPVANGTGTFNGTGQASFDLTDAEATGDRRFYRFTLP